MIAEAGRIGESWLRQMKTTEEACKYAAEQSIAGKEALKKVMEARPKEIAEKDAELHANA